MPNPLKPPPGWEDAHDVFVILFLSKGADFNDFKFADVMNNTYTRNCDELPESSQRAPRAPRARRCSITMKMIKGENLGTFQFG